MNGFSFAGLPRSPRMTSRNAFTSAVAELSKRLLLIWVTLILFCPPGIVLSATAGGMSPPVQEEQQQKKKKKKEEEKKKPEDSKLGDFEDEATDDGERADEYADGDSDGSSGWAAVVGTVVFEMTKYLFVYGGSTSWYRVHGPPYLDADDTGQAGQMMVPYISRETGEPVIPFVGLNLDYQNVESDVYAASSRLEAGYGPVAAQFKWTHYKEEDPATELDLIQWHGLYRMSFSQYVELDIGLGQMIISGESESSGFSLALPLRIQFSRYFGLSFRPAWGWIASNTISDVELGLSGSLRFVSVNAGYRWVSAGSASLNGPVIGVAFHM